MDSVTVGKCIGGEKERESNSIKTNKMTKFFGIVFLIVSFFACNQKIENDNISFIEKGLIKENPNPYECYDKQYIIQELSLKNKVSNEYIGITGSVSEEYLIYKALKEKSTIEDLVDLTKHESPVVVCYSIWGLKSQGFKSWERIEDHVLDNEDCIDQVSGCNFSDISVRAFYISNVVKIEPYQERDCQESNSQIVVKEI